MPNSALLTPDNLGVIVNEADPLSVQIANYYQQVRQIPPANLVRIRFPQGRTELSPQDFQRIKADVDRRLPRKIQALALTWTVPYRVGCMSITSAFAFGFDPGYCAQGCQATKPSPYFNSRVSLPYDQLKMRPTMAIAAMSFSQAQALIDRGVAGDRSYPTGTAYLMQTTDPDRNVRAEFYPSISQQLGSLFEIQIKVNNRLLHQSNVMFYFTGLSQVEQLASNRFRPGAIADHLTSFGGMLTDSPQMSSLRWLEAGATGSYGTVVEPCNFPQKFPHPGVAMYYYLKGETLLEAYWKSVAWPGQGIFIGEPLSHPFR